MLVNFSLTNAAAKRISELANLEGKAHLKLRISVLGGGCSGFKYQYSFEEKTSENDTLYTLNGAEVVVDDISLEFLKDSILDYAEDLGSAGFEIRNPNATAKCGCGNSFSV